MIVASTILLVLHITLAALWLGPPLGLNKTLARGLAGGQDALRTAMGEFRFRGGLARIGGTGVLVTGLALIFVRGGFGAVAPQFHAALGIVVLAIVNSIFFGILGARVDAAANDYSEAKRGDAAQAIKRIGIHSHVQHAFWLAALILMLLPR